MSILVRDSRFLKNANHAQVLRDEEIPDSR